MFDVVAHVIDLTEKVTASHLEWEAELLGENRDKFTRQLRAVGRIEPESAKARGVGSEFGADPHSILECVKFANATYETLKLLAAGYRLTAGRLDGATTRMIQAEWVPRLIASGLPPELATEIAARYATELATALLEKP